MNRNPDHSALRLLARLYGVQTSYRDVLGRTRRAADESLRHVLRALGAADDLDGALRQRQHEIWRQSLDPVIVAFDGRLQRLRLRVQDRDLSHRVKFFLQQEDGATQHWETALRRLSVHQWAEVDDTRYLSLVAPAVGRVPSGYHQLRAAFGGKEFEALLISTPRRAYTPQDTAQRHWGVFAPLYAIHSSDGLGSGNFSDLQSLEQWVRGLGGHLTATLPLLAAFLDEPFEPSPYAPVSRLFWNEFFLDVRQVPELQHSPEARRVLEADDFRRQAAALREAPQVDYRAGAALARRVLQPLAETLFARGGSRRAELEEFVGGRPLAEDYARFRAVCDRQRCIWRDWPQAQHDGRLTPDDYAQSDYHYHLYVQWLAARRMQELSEDTRRGGLGLYLDYPLGVHRWGFDTWKYRGLFAENISGGSPPDTIFTKGQKWGFPPLDPQGLRADHYQYFIACVRQHVRHAALVRVDHVMGLHRLYWIPEELPATEGVYVQYPAEELYAVWLLESHRHRSQIIGENLGTVPGYVDRAMRRHGIHPMYVVQYELRSEPRSAPRPVPSESVLSTNTHDMPTFAAFWRGLDLDELHHLGIYDDETLRESRQRRARMRENLLATLRREQLLPDQPQPPDEAAILTALLHWQARSPARLMLVNLEDLWLETHAHNLPGTGGDRLNWRPKLRYSLETLQALPAIADQLRQVAWWRSADNTPTPSYHTAVARRGQRDGEE